MERIKYTTYLHVICACIILKLVILSMPETTTSSATTSATASSASIIPSTATTSIVIVPSRSVVVPLAPRLLTICLLYNIIVIITFNVTIKYKTHILSLVKAASSCASDFTFTVPFSLILILWRSFSFTTVFRQVNLQRKPFLLIHCKKSASIKDQTSRLRLYNTKRIFENKVSVAGETYIIYFAVILFANMIQVYEDQPPHLSFSFHCYPYVRHYRLGSDSAPYSPSPCSQRCCC